jgi:hypothetical protein
MVPRTTRTPLRDVALDGVYRYVHQLDAIGRTALAALVTVTLPLPWHRVYATNALDLTAFVCAMTPDGHPGPSEPLHDTGIVTTCTGLAHGGTVVLLLMMALLGVAVVPLGDSTRRLTGYASRRLSGAGTSRACRSATAVPGSSHAPHRSRPMIAGIRSWRGATAALGGVVITETVRTSSPAGSFHISQRPSEREHLTVDWVDEHRAHRLVGRQRSIRGSG